MISIHALREEGDRILNNIDHYVDISIHALREEGDVVRTSTAVVADVFLSTPSARRATVKKTGHCGISLVFLSTPSARRATYDRIFEQLREGYFYPRPPRGGRRDFVGEHPGARQFLSTPSARRATKFTGFLYVRCEISIHALREEGDR